MKKLMLSLVAVAALGSGAAWADAECQAGSAWGAKPGCGHPDEPQAITNNSGGPVAPGYGYGYSYVIPGVLGAFGLPQVVAPQAAQRIFIDPATGLAYNQPRPPRRWDRDGDGIPNSRDRYPDDPRFY